jgi:hypothetical protein
MSVCVAAAPESHTLVQHDRSAATQNLKTKRRTEGTCPLKQVSQYLRSDALILRRWGNLNLR